MSRRHFLTTSATTLAAATPGWGAIVRDGPSDLPTTWDLKDLYADDAAWAADRTRLSAMIPTLERWRNGFGESAASFREALTAISQAQREIGRLELYARLKSDADQRDAANQERRGQAAAVMAALDRSTAWFDPAVVALGPSRVDSLLAADPQLARFGYSLHNLLRLAPHTLPAAEESLLAAAGMPLSTPFSTFSQLTNSEMPRATVTLSDGSRVRLDDQGYERSRTSADAGDRRRVFDGFWSGYAQFEGTLGTTLGGQLAANNFEARARHYPGALEAALGPANTPPAAFHTMIAEAHRGIPLFQRHLALRKRLLRVDTLRYSDIYAPLAKLDSTFDPATKRAIMLEAVVPLGSVYRDKLAAASAGSWVDLTARTGKYSGGYTADTAYGVHPYILLNDTPDFHGLTTYVHEWGHAMHSVLAQAAQPYETSRYAVFVAEIASTCNELLLADHLIRTARTAQEKLFYIAEQLETMRLSMFREAILSEFELLIHQRDAAGEAMSGKTMSSAYLDLLKTYCSPAMEIEALYGVEWAFIPHLYMNFYTFQYATSIAASAFFSRAILKGDGAVRERYLAMLASGGKDDAYKLVQAAGVDLATPAPYRAFMQRYGELIAMGEALAT